MSSEIERAEAHLASDLTYDDSEDIIRNLLEIVRTLPLDAEDAKRWKWAVEHARWLRHEHEAYVAIPVAVDADLSCVAMRVRAVDQARAAALAGGEGG